MKSTIEFKTGYGVLRLGKCEIAIPAPLLQPISDSEQAVKAPTVVEFEITITTTNQEFKEAVERMLREAE